MKLHPRLKKHEINLEIRSKIEKISVEFKKE